MERFSDLPGRLWFQGSEEVLFGFRCSFLRLPEKLTARLRQLDDVASPVGGVGPPSDDALAFETVEQGDHRGAVDTEQLRDFLLRCWLSTRENPQHSQSPWIDPERLQRLGCRRLQLQMSVLEQVTEGVRYRTTQTFVARHASRVSLV